MSKLLKKLLLKIIDLIKKLFVGKDNNLNNTLSKLEDKESSGKVESITENLETDSEIDSEIESKPVEESNFSEKSEQEIETNPETESVLVDSVEIIAESEEKQNQDQEQEQELKTKDDVIVLEPDSYNNNEIPSTEDSNENEITDITCNKESDSLIPAEKNEGLFSAAKLNIKAKISEINKKYKESVEAIDNWEKQRLKEIAEEEKEIERLYGKPTEEEGVIDITPKSEPKSSKIDIKNDPLIQKTRDLNEKFNQLLKQKGIK